MIPQNVLTINKSDNNKFVIVNVFPIVYSTSSNIKEPFRCNSIGDVWTNLHISMLNNKYEIPSIKGNNLVQYNNIAFLFITCSSIVDNANYDDIINNSNYFVYQNLSLQCNNEEKLIILRDTYKFPLGTQCVCNNNCWRSFISLNNHVSKELHVIYDQTNVLLTPEQFNHISCNYINYSNLYKIEHQVFVKYWISRKLLDS